MRCEQRFCADFFGKVFHNRPRNGKPVVSACAAPDFVQNEKAVFGGVEKNGGDFRHFHHKGRLIVYEIIAGAHPREHTIDQRNLRRFCGDETADMRHYRD